MGEMSTTPTGETSTTPGGETSLTPRGEKSATLAVLEVLDRDGGVRHRVAVHAWPLRVGRALDNDLVLDDPFTAPHHFSVAADEAGQVVLTVGPSVNGLQLVSHLGSHRLATNERAVIATAPGDAPPLVTLGRTHLRLRLAGHALPPEQVLGTARVLAQALPTLAWLTLVTAAVLGFDTWLDSEPDLLAKSLASFAMSALAIGLGWSGVWTLLSKVFTGSGHFGWHLRVMLLAVLAWQAVLAGSALLAFAFSWPWATDFNFVPGYAIAGVMLYFHLQAVEPHRPQRTLAFALASVFTGVGLSVWMHLQASDRVGSELYMNHLFPPALRVAKPVDTAEFMQGVAVLQARLDAKAKKADAEE